MPSYHEIEKREKWPVGNIKRNGYEAAPLLAMKFGEQLPTRLSRNNSIQPPIDTNKRASDI